MKKVLSAAALVLTAGMLTSCGGGPPDDASKSEFCGTFKDFQKDTADLGDGDDAKIIKAFKDVGDKLEEVGTPSDISESERRGFEKTLEEIDNLKDDAKVDELDKIDDGESSSEKKDTDAFDKYLNDTCGV
jgi:hypothetical protein